MALDLALLAASAAMSAVVQGSLRRGYGTSAALFERALGKEPLSKPLQNAFAEAWKGFEASLRAGYVLSAATERNLGELARSEAWGQAVSQLLERRAAQADLQTLREAFRIHGPPEQEDEDFAAAWRAAGKRFQRAAAAAAPLKRLLDLAYGERLEALAESQDTRLARIEAHLLAFLEQQTRLSDRSDGSTPDDSLAPYLNKVLLETRQLTIQGIASSEGESRLAILYPIEELYTPLKATGSALMHAGCGDPDDDSLDPTPAGLLGPDARHALEQRDVTLPDLLARHHHLLLLGAPGAGKTTFLRLIACVLAKDCLHSTQPDYEPARARHLGLDPAQPPPVPIFLRLAALAGALAAPRGAADACDGLLACLEREHGASATQGLAALLDQGRCMLLLDGLDEVVEPRLRARLVTLMTGVLERWANNRLVISSRPFDFAAVAGLAGVETATVADFSADDVAEFLRRWVRALHPGGVVPEGDTYLPELKTALSETRHIRQMARNPVMLTCLCVVHWNERRLPAGKAALLKAVIRWLLNAKEERRRALGWTNLFAEQCFKALAVAMTTDAQGKQVVVDLATAAQWLKQPFEEMRGITGRKRLHEEGLRFLEEEMLASGIIERVGLGQLRFWHLTFQEHLAAKALTELDDGDGPDGWWATLRPHLCDRQWTEVLEHFAGCLLPTGLRRTKVLMQRLLSPACPDDLAATAQAVGAAGRVLSVLSVYGYRPPVDLGWDELRARALGIFEPEGAARVPVEQRLAAAEALAQAGDPRLRRPLLERMLPVPGVEGLLLGQYPVTVQEYEQFVLDGGYSDQGLWSEKGWGWLQGAGVAAPDDRDDQLLTVSRPVVGVSWYEAEAYCRWLAREHRRPYCLPLEQEWEAAATHPAGDYPWGEATPTPESANYSEGRIGHATPVGIYPAGVGRGGHLDLAGNVWEWCDDLIRVDDDGDETRALRGGGCYYSARDLRSAIRDRSPALLRSGFIGFRVCLPPRAR